MFSIIHKKDYPFINKYARLLQIKKSKFHSVNVNASQRKNIADHLNNYIPYVPITRIDHTFKKPSIRNECLPTVFIEKLSHANNVNELNDNIPDEDESYGSDYDDISEFNDINITQLSQIDNDFMDEVLSESIYHETPSMISVENIPLKKQSSLINDEVSTRRTLCDTSDNENSNNNCDVLSLVIDATDKADDGAHSLQGETFPLNNELPSPEQIRNASSIRSNDHSYDVSLPMIDTEDEDYVPTSEVSQQNEQDILIEPNNESFVIPDPSISSGARNPEEMYVVPSGDKKRRDFCYYCHTFQSVISRHLELKHRDQPEVEAFAMMPKGDVERKKIIDTLRKNGNYVLNTNTQYNDGELLVSHQPNKKWTNNASDYVVCHNCRGYYTKLGIFKHRKLCINGHNKNNRSYSILSRKIAGRLHCVANRQLSDVVFPPLRDDEVTRLIRIDELLIIFANKLCTRYTNQHQHAMIRARLRLMGRLLRTLKLDKELGIDDFASIFSPKYYDDVINAINKVCGYNEETNDWESPSNIATYGIYLKKIGKCLIVELIKREDSDRRQKVKDFLTVHEEEYHCRLNKLALEKVAQNNRRNEKPLPLDDDISKFYKYCESQWIISYDSLKEEYNFEAWLTLLQMTLLLLMLFNRRRRGEMEQLPIADFQYENFAAEQNENLLNTLSDKDQVLAKKYVRLITRGKKSRDVPVIISMEMVKCMELLLSYRKQANVHDKNPFVFGIPGFHNGVYSLLDTCDLIRKFSLKCGAKYPDRLRGTAFRKHFATKCASLEVDESRIVDVANHMGHHENIHRNIYRETTLRRDLCGVSKLLEKTVGLSGRSLADELNEDSEDEEYVYDEDEHDESTINDDSLSEKRLQMSRNKSKKNRCQQKSVVNRSSSSNDKSFSSKNQNSKHHKKRNSGFSPNTSNVGSTVDKRKSKKRRWTEMEKSIVLGKFKEHIKRRKLPSASSIRQVINDNECITRTEAQVRTWISCQFQTVHEKY